jgi:hypothetical protein
MNVTDGRKNRPTREGKPEQKFDAAFETVFKISIFKEASRYFIFIFLFSRKRKIKKHLHMYRNYGTGTNFIIL